MGRLTRWERFLLIFKNPIKLRDDADYEQKFIEIRKLGTKLYVTKVYEIRQR